jgi:hypothetical protein
MKIYQCNECKVKETEDLEQSKWIEMGGKDKSFFFVKFSEKGDRVLSNWGHLHFCSKECFTKHFLGE